jgi:HAD superfamily hydrolase (TIGR01509 family)
MYSIFTKLFNNSENSDSNNLQMSKNNQFKTILFDLDGVLVNTCEIQFTSIKDALIKLKKFDLLHSDNKYYCNIFKQTITTYQKLEYLVGNNIIEKDEIEQIYELKKEIANEYFKKTLSEDIDKINLMHFLKENNINIGVVTNGNPISANIILNSIGILDYIDFLITNEDCINHKPHSEPYIRAMMHFGGKLEDYLILEDSEVGLESAKGTGTTVFQVYSPNDVNINLIKSYFF